MNTLLLPPLLWFSVAGATRSKQEANRGSNDTRLHATNLQWGQDALGEGLRRRDRWEEDCRGARVGVHAAAVRET